MIIDKNNNSNDSNNNLRIKVATAISGAAVIIGVGFLITSLYYNDPELKTWATGLISLVVGASIGFIFNGTRMN